MTVRSESTKQIFWLVLIGLIVRLLALPFVHTDDADAVTRVFMAYKWLQKPHWIVSDVWLPLHLYMNAFIIRLSGGDLIYAPKLVNILFAVATVIPLYKFTENEFKTRDGAFFVSLTYLFIPIVLRNSFYALSGIPYAFFIALAMYLLSQGKKLKQPVKYGMLAGLTMTIAGGFRYEAWLLIAVFTLILLLQKQWKMMVVFWVFAMIFPAIWMAGSYMEHGDLFYGSNGAYRWNVVLSGVNDEVSWKMKAWRLVYFPLMYFLMITPVIFTGMVYYLYKSFKNKELKTGTVWWLLPFSITLLTFIYKASNGTLLLQPRFTLSLIITSIPFYGLAFKDGRYKKLIRIIAWVVILLLIPYSYLLSSIRFPYTDAQKVDAFPRVQDKTTDNILEIIQAEKDKNDSLVLVQDFIGWDKTYFIGIRSGIAPDHIFFVNGARHGKVYAADMARVVNKSDKGILVKKNRSKMDRHIYFLNDSVVEVRKLSRYMILSPKYKNGDLTLYTYRLDGKAPSVFYEYRKIFNEHTNEILQIEQKIKNDSSWYRSTVNQSEKRGIEADTMLRLNAIYLYEQKQKK